MADQELVPHGSDSSMKRKCAAVWKFNEVRTVIASSTDTVTLRLKSGGSYVVHKKLLSHLSTYYQSLFSGAFSSCEDPDAIEDISASTFGIFVVWLNSGTVHGESKAETFIEDIIDCYIYADRYDFPALRRALITKLSTHNRCIWINKRTVPVLTHAQVNRVFDNLPPTSPLCSLDIEYYAAGFRTLVDSTEKALDLHATCATAIVYRMAEQRATPYADHPDFELGFPMDFVDKSRFTEQDQ